MATRINGDNIEVPGQITVVGNPVDATNVVVVRKAGTLKVIIEALDLNAAAPSDLTTLTVGSSLYVPVRCIVFNPTANLSGASLGLYTAAAAGGVAVVAPVALATLTGVGKFQSLAIAALTDVVTSGDLFPRLTVASGVAGTASLLIEFVELGLI